MKLGGKVSGPCSCPKALAPDNSHATATLPATPAIKSRNIEFPPPNTANPNVEQEILFQQTSWGCGPMTDSMFSENNEEVSRIGPRSNYAMTTLVHASTCLFLTMKDA
jgi:hypothetical protein